MCAFWLVDSACLQREGPISIIDLFTGVPVRPSQAVRISIARIIPVTESVYGWTFALSDGACFHHKRVFDSVADYVIVRAPFCSQVVRISNTTGLIRIADPSGMHVLTESVYLRYKDYLYVADQVSALVRGLTGSAYLRYH
jgi:hypothetical protein